MREELTTKTVEISTYIAEDGTEFSKASDCEQYERKVQKKRIIQQIVKKDVTLDEDPTRGMNDDMTLMFLQTQEQWEAFYGMKFPSDRTFKPNVTLLYTEEFNDHGDRYYEKSWTDPYDLANILEKQAQHIREMAVEVTREATLMASSEGSSDE